MKTQTPIHTCPICNGTGELTKQERDKALNALEVANQAIEANKAARENGDHR